LRIKNELRHFTSLAVFEVIHYIRTMQNAANLSRALDGWAKIAPLTRRKALVNKYLRRLFLLFMPNFLSNAVNILILNRPWSTGAFQ